MPDPLDEARCGAYPVRVLDDGSKPGCPSRFPDPAPPQMPHRLARPPASATLRRVTITAGLAAAVLLPASPARGQEIPRDEYLVHLPLGLPRLMPATSASTGLDLWGDPAAPGYRDVDPVDGIDDGRHRVLLDLAVRFAPFLVQNTGDFPVDFRVYMENRDSFPLYLDTWDVTGEEPERVGGAAVNFATLGSCDRSAVQGLLEAEPRATRDPALEDCKLLDLMDRFSPGSGRSASVDAALIRGEPSLQHVLFFNFPGDGSRTWKQAYRPEWERTPEARRASFPHAFVHPFLTEVEDPGSGTGYEIVLQYWFFYPTNDSGMDHEGDWEHLNVILTPRSRRHGALRADEVQRILDGETDPDDPLVLKRVDFYFHHSVWPLDFTRPDAYAPREAWLQELDALDEERFRQREIWRATRAMVWADDDETTLNTHPFGYIGGDNKGLNQALEAPGGSNRDPHGTYPFPGRYTGVGPGGTTDHLTAYADVRSYLADLDAGRADMGPGFEKESILGLADPARLPLLPDWERLVEPVRTDADIRREWVWMLLPVRWGYPATSSPFAGVLENYNTGNVAPQGPSYNAGWNVTGGGPGFTEYDPHTIPPVFPLAVQDNFRNDLGFLNLTLPLILNLPPLDFISRVVAYPFRAWLGRGDPVFYPNEAVPYRFAGISSGLSLQWFDPDFRAMALNSQHFEQFILSLALHIVQNGITEDDEVVGTTDFIDRSTGTFVQVPFYFGRFASENTVRHARASFGVGVEWADAPSYLYQADIAYWEYAGSIRFTPLRLGFLEPFAKLGYGWSWYRLENVRSTVGPFDPADTDWVTPGFWPNVWHFGAGFEIVPRRRIGELPGGLDLAVRIEYNRYAETLGLDLDRIPLDELGLVFPTLADLPETGVHRHELLLGLTLSF